MDAITIQVTSDGCVLLDRDVRNIESHVAVYQETVQRNKLLAASLGTILHCLPSDVCSMIGAYGVCVTSVVQLDRTEQRLYDTLDTLEREDAFDLRYYDVYTEDYQWAHSRLTGIRATRTILRISFDRTRTTRPGEVRLGQIMEGAGLAPHNPCYTMALGH